MGQSQAYSNKNCTSCIDFHGASIINEVGEEIPITEQMVHQACQQLILQWEQSQQHDTSHLIQVKKPSSWGMT
ncbi:MAG: hypothetical protein GXP08_09430 [Gammaproteobacteria bacterium]|nr:hypothetical protein [Gammaproteobacteria bacterium]